MKVRERGGKAQNRTWKDQITTFMILFVTRPFLTLSRR